MKHLGDITKIKGSEVPMVDIVTFGAPCQDLSVAGKRAGMKHEALGDDETTRSGLFYEAIRIIKEMRDECTRQLQMRGTAYDSRLVKPRFAVYENVPGAFSSNKGEDFRCVLEETAKIVQEDAVIPGPPRGGWSYSGCIMGDGWSIAWRLHDAQFWGVPQRRKRISLVADFGGESAPEILFERESVSGNIESCEPERQEAAGGAGAGTDKPSSFTVKIRGGCERDSGGRKAGKGALVQEEKSGTLGVSQDQTLITVCCNSNGEDISPPLDANYYKGCGEREGIEREYVCVSQDAYDKFKENSKSASLKASGGTYGGGVGSISDTVGALCAGDSKGVGNQYVSQGKCIIQRIE